MRAGLATALAATGLALVLSGCGGGSDTANSGPDCTVPGPRPAVALLAEPASQPTARAQICELATDFRNVVMEPAWDAAAKALLAVNHDVGLWQRRTLLLACTGCRSSGLDLAQVRDDHPQWILHDSAGREVHLVGHPDQVLLDFGDPDYQGAWSLRIQQSLDAGGWTGVAVVDAGNAPEWSATPVDPRTQTELDPGDRATYLAQALSLVHAAMRTHGFFLLAQNGPPEIVEPAQINSADALDAGAGFARLRGSAWLTLFEYYMQVQRERTAAFVFESGPDPGPKRDVYGLAAYLLVATPQGAYGLAPGSSPASLYDLDLGAPDPDVVAEQVGEAWRRTYPNGAVAVNPSDLPTELTLGDAGEITLPAGGAAVTVGSRLITSY